MSTRTRRARVLTTAVVQEVRAENLTFMAGSIAYHAFVSLLPLLLLLLAVASLAGNRTVEQAIFEVAGAMLTTGAGDVLVDELQTARGSTGLSVLGLAVLLWGTLRIFRGLDTAFSDIYESEEENTMLDQLADGILVLVTVGAAIVAGGVVQRAAVSTGIASLDRLLGGLLAAAALSIALYPMYYVFPDEDVSPLEVVPGTVFAAVGLAVFQGLFGLYLEFSARSADPNVVTSVIVLLTWLYFSGLVVLVGAVVNAVLANRSRDVDVVPVFGDVQSAGPAPASRDQLVEAVEALQGLLDGHPEVSVGADGETVAVPSPTHVLADTETPLLFGGSRPVTLELQWTPAPEEGSSTDAGEAGDASGGAGDSVEPGDGDDEPADVGADGAAADGADGDADDGADAGTDGDQSGEATTEQPPDG